MSFYAHCCTVGCTWFSRSIAMIFSFLANPIVYQTGCLTETSDRLVIMGSLHDDTAFRFCCLLRLNNDSLGPSCVYSARGIIITAIDLFGCASETLVPAFLL